MSWYTLWAAMGQRTKSLRDSPLKRVLEPIDR